MILFDTLKEIKTSIDRLTERMEEVERLCYILERNEKRNRELNTIHFDEIWKVLQEKQPEEKVRYIVKFYNGDYLFTDIKPTKQKMVNGEWQDAEDTT